MTAHRRALRHLDAFTVSILILAAVYALLAWTPSSYGVQLARIGLPGAGLVAGQPREIREDEWIRWTSFFRVAVNNRFQRFNETSPYGEDLRNVEGLPLADWGLVFKPYHWPFFVVDAPHAFSFYHAFWIAAFLIGYHHVFRRLDLPAGLAAAASVTLFFTSFAQVWWTTYGPVMSGFPWVVLVALTSARSWRGSALKVILLGYAIASWALANLYPPIMITLGFVALVVIVAFRRELLRPRALLVGALGAGLGGVLIFLYYRDVFFVMAGTIYPGQRLAGGGGQVPGAQWIAHLFPYFVTDGYDNLVNDNICEASTVGTYVPLLALCFGDLGALRASLSDSAEARRLRWQLAVLAIGVVVTSIWLLVPLPAAVGMPLLWHRVPGFRMWFACGLLTLVLAMTALRAMTIRLTWPRWTLFVAAVLVAGLVASRILPGGSFRPWEELGILLPLGLVLLLRAGIGSAARSALVASAALANLAAFGMFNPIQSAKPIFEPPATPVTEALDRLAERHPEGWLVLESGYGAWLNGMGYKSVTHVLYAPEMEFFRSRFPDLPQSEFDLYFNRTAYIGLWARASARLEGCCEITIPIQPFDPPTVPVDVVDSPDSGLEAGGAETFRGVEVDPAGLHLTIAGWGMFDASGPEARLRVGTDLPVRAAVAYPSLRHEAMLRGGDPGLAMSGFTLVLDLDLESVHEALSNPPDGTGAGDSQEALRRIATSPICIVSVDPQRGAHVLPGSSCTASAPGPGAGD